MKFVDRTDAGRQLAESVTITNPENTIVLALPRGGIPLGIEIAKKYHVALDVIVAKKIAHPYQREYAIGAIAEQGEPIFNEIEKQLINSEWLLKEIARVKTEIQTRRELYDQLLNHYPLTGKDVIVVDDGIATGLTLYAAIKAIKEANPNSIIIAVPIIPKDTYEVLESLVDKIFYVEIPSPFLGSVGAYYYQFPQLTNDEIQLMLTEYRE